MCPCKRLADPPRLTNASLSTLKAQPFSCFQTSETKAPIPPTIVASQPRHPPQGWKLVYSGDTRPCERLVRAGAGATLLIHEATFEPGLDAHALRKRHSTSAEALSVARRMRAYRTLLTHFSQRYPKLPAGVDACAAKWRERPVLGFDGMVVPLALLPVLPALTPVVAAALGEEEGGGAGVGFEVGEQGAADCC